MLVGYLKQQNHLYVAEMVKKEAGGTRGTGVSEEADCKKGPTLAGDVTVGKAGDRGVRDSSELLFDFAVNLNLLKIED